MIETMPTLPEKHQKRRFSLVSSPINLLPNVDLPSLSNFEPYDLSTKPTDFCDEGSLIDVFGESSAFFDDTPSLTSIESSEEPKKKKRKKRNDKNHKFRPYQAEKWQERYSELLEFREKKGHCLVPHTFPENPPLARWVKRQRYQYKLLQETKQSSMTQERIKILEDIGFIWDSHEAAWEERLKELLDFKESKGNCLVPSNYPTNPQLATWVKCQRRQYKLYWEGRPSNMTVERIMVLEKHGFEWELRASSSFLRKAKLEKTEDLITSDKVFLDLMSDLSEDDLSHELSLECDLAF